MQLKCHTVYFFFSLVFLIQWDPYFARYIHTHSIIVCDSCDVVCLAQLNIHDYAFSAYGHQL